MTGSGQASPRPRRPRKSDSPGAQNKARTVALLGGPRPEILAETQARGWRLLHLQHSNYVVPPRLEIDGALLLATYNDPRIRKALTRVRAAVRLGSAPAPEARRFPAVLPDQAAEGRLAAGHFAERGFRQVGYVGSRPLQELRPLFESFRDRSAELGMACHLLEIDRGALARSQDPHIMTKQRVFTEWLRSVPKPVGILAPNDSRAARYAFWTAEAGFNVPLEVAILGRGNMTEICESVTPTLSSIDPDKAGLARAACDLLARLMAGEPPPRKPVIVPPAVVVERESTRLLVTADPQLAAALRYLREHLREELSVDGVAREVGVSRRKLERAFQQHLHRGINDELRRIRLEEFCRLMLTTDRSIARLAPEVGFHNLANLYRAFKAACGMTPRQYRMRNAERGMRNGEGAEGGAEGGTRRP